MNQLPSPANRLSMASQRHSAASIARDIRRLIMDDQMIDGEQLPAERLLAQRYHVARNTVREALRRLSDSGFLVRRPGSGTYVRYRAPMEVEDIAEQTSPLELIEVRMSVERDITRLAVSNATARDLARLEATLRRLECCGADPAEFSKWDEEFHLELAECTRNPLMISIYRQINDVRGHAQWNARSDSILSTQRIQQYNIQHRAIYVAIANRDVDSAITQITNHLSKARSDLLGTS